MEIIFKTDVLPTADAVIALYNAAGLPRPTDDKHRIQQMIDHADLLVTAWNDNILVGVSRNITDWVWCCYLADLAVHPDYQQFGIGRQLIALTREKVGELSMVLLLSVPGAMTYYPKVGFAKEDRAFMISRKK